MKSILFFTFIHFFYLAMGTDTSTCNKLWETTNTINNVPLYSMKIYACVETPTYNLPINPPIIHDHIKNHTNGLFKNIPPFNISNSTLLNSTNNTHFIYLSNSSETNLTKTLTISSTKKTLNLTSPSPSYINNAPFDNFSETTPSSTTIAPSPDINFQSPTIMTPSPSSNSETTKMPIDNKNINEPNENFDNNQTSSNSSLNMIKQDTSLIHITIILSVIVSLVSLYGTYRLVKYCIEKKKCHDILRKTNPEPDETNSDDKNRDKHNDKNEIISHTLDNMEKAKLRDIERKKSIGIYKKKTEYTKGARWKKSVKKVRKVNAINKSLTRQNVPINRHVRQTVREDLIRQSKSMPNGENNPTIKKLIKRLDDTDKEEKKQEDIEIPGTPPPPTQDTTNITRPIRKPPIYPPGMGHD